MRPRTPTILWIPFLFSIGTFSWALLIAGLTLLSLVIITPPLADLRAAEAQRNDLQGTLDLCDQQLTLQKEFVIAATQDKLQMERLASLQLNLNRPNQQILALEPTTPPRDRSIDSLLAHSLVAVHPAPVKPLPWYLQATQAPGLRPLLVMLSCAALALSFFLGIKYDRS